MTSIIAQDEHLDETPAVSFLFAAITAISASQIKALTTTLQNAATILKDGYEFDRVNPCYYLVTAPVDKKGEQAIYNIAYDPALGVASCSCHANANIGTCKHVVGLHMHKAKIDELHDKRVADIAQAAEALRLEELAQRAAADAEAAPQAAPAFWTRATQRPVCADETGTFTVISGWNSWDDFWREADKYMPSGATA